MRKENMRDYILIYVNGQRYQIAGKQGFQSLSDFLRYDLGKVGTKVVCAEGDCGSCTVLIGRVRNSQMRYEGINSCIQYLYQLDCTHIITVEGLKDEDKILHPIQKAMVDSAGSQCGYCTPGFVMALAAMIETGEELSRHSVQEGLTGNLCRCTGYEQIIDAGISLNKKIIPKASKHYNNEKIFADIKKHVEQSVFCEYEKKWNGEVEQIHFFVPATLEEALEFKQKQKKVIIVAGGTDISVQINKDRIEPNSIMSLTHLNGLEILEIKNKAVIVGAKVTWSELGEFCLKNLPELAEIISIFASRQIKNAATLAGNIANASPIADSIPFLHVIDAEIELTSSDGTRWVKVKRFYHGYKKTEMKPEELITRVRWNLPNPEVVLKLYKVSKRKDLDISTFTAGILLNVKKGKIQNARLAFGGVAPIVLRLRKTEEFLKSKPMLATIFKEAGQLAREEISPISDVRASSDYRLQLAENIMLKFYRECYEKSKNKEAV